jgi:acetyltransferase-like isoleucine patch superfamily enzyme
MVGGEAIIICHAAERGHLKLKRVKIGSHVTIGTRTVIFPGVEIGDRAVIGAGSLVLKGEKVPPGAVYLGVPARDVRAKTDEK